MAGIGRVLRTHVYMAMTDLWGDIPYSEANVVGIETPKADPSVDIYNDLTYYLRSIDRPLIILDEAGDLKNEAMLELKALWNATERCCAWYMMGADGLKERLRRSIESKMVGYTEMLSRYGDRYNHVTPDDARERERFLMDQAALVAKVNAPEGCDVPALVRKTQGGLRRVYTEIEKLRLATSY